MSSDPTQRSQRTARIVRLLNVARELAADASLVPVLAPSTGLSPNGVRYAFEHSLESSDTLDIEAVFSSAHEATRSCVILSANVFLAPLRALTLALAGSDEVVAVPSSREPHFTEALVRSANLDSLTVARTLDVASVDTGDIHVYGSDETIASVKRAAKVTVRGHGTGFGVARIDPGHEPSLSAALVARDVALFDQRGCLSPRIVFVVGPTDFAEHFGDLLHRALAEIGKQVPRGTLSRDEGAEATTFCDTNAYVGRLWKAEHHAVGLMETPSTLTISPTGRHVQLVRVDTESEAARLLAPLARFVTTIGASTRDRAVAFGVPHARIAELGTMQSPPLDGPVDLR